MPRCLLTQSNPAWDPGKIPLSLCSSLIYIHPIVLSKRCNKGIVDGKFLKTMVTRNLFFKASGTKYPFCTKSQCCLKSSGICNGSQNWDLEYGHGICQKCIRIQVDLGVVVSNDLKWLPLTATFNAAEASRLLDFLYRDCKKKVLST